MQNTKFPLNNDLDGHGSKEQFYSVEDIPESFSKNSLSRSSSTSLLSDQISSIYSRDSGSVKRTKFRFCSDDKLPSLEDLDLTDKDSVLTQASISTIDGDHDSGVDESTQGQPPDDVPLECDDSDELVVPLTKHISLPKLVLNLPLQLRSALKPTKKEPQTNGEIGSPKKTLDSRKIHGSPTKLPKASTRTPKETPPATGSSTSSDKKKIPMNKVQVGTAASPNLKSVKSKIGSLQNATHRPGGGNVKIENKKLDFSKAQPRVTAKNDKYAPKGGEKKIITQKLNWSAKSKIGSLENAAHKPGGGDKKIETVKVDFKDRAKSKVGSRDNIKHAPGGGAVKDKTSNIPDIIIMGRF